MIKQGILEVVFCVFLYLGSMEDIQKREVSSKWIWGIFGWGLVKWIWGDGAGLLFSILGSVLPLLFFFLILWCFPKSIGGGDIKWMMACGFFLGGKQVIVALVFGVLLAFPLAFYFVLRRENKKELPWIPFLSIGVLLSQILGEEILRWYLN